MEIDATCCAETRLSQRATCCAKTRLSQRATCCAKTRLSQRATCCAKTRLSQRATCCAKTRLSQRATCCAKTRLSQRATCCAKTRLSQRATCCHWGTRLNTGNMRTSLSSRKILGSLSKGVFERRTVTGNETFSLFTHLGATVFVVLSVFTGIEAIYLKIRAHPLPKNEKRPLPVAVRRSKTPLLKLPNVASITSP